jgi:hypothetical protein
MASKIITKGLKRTALSVALGMCFGQRVCAVQLDGLHRRHHGERHRC